jgi:hypothetical protein
MHIAVTRIDAKRYLTVVERNDGVKLQVPGYGFMRALPHDLCHYVVETALKLPRGFWGSVAGGAKLAGMVLVEGRQKPHTKEQAKATLKANAAHLSEAERLVACFETLVNSGLDHDWPAAEALLKEVSGGFHHKARPISRSDFASVCAAWRAMQSQWDALPIGDCLHLEWKLTGRSSRSRHRR